MNDGKMKGISPLVAVIMLIAFTLIVAGMLAMFVTQMTESEISASEHCMEARLMIRKATYDIDAKTLKVTVFNNGKVPLNLRPLLSFENETTHPTGTEIYNQSFLIKEDSFDIFTLTDVSDDLIEITMKSTACDPPCYECAAAQDFLGYVNIKGIGY